MSSYSSRLRARRRILRGGWNHPQKFGRNPRNGHEWYIWQHRGVYYEAFKWMLDKRNWRRHPKPFAKTAAGRRRRMERRFMIKQNLEKILYV